MSEELFSYQTGYLYLFSANMSHKCNKCGSRIAEDDYFFISIIKEFEKHLCVPCVLKNLDLYYQYIKEQDLNKLLKSLAVIARIEIPEFEERKLKKIEYLLLNGLLPELEQLLEQDLSFVNFTDLLQRTPLHVAVEQNKPEVLDLFLRRNANVNLQDFRGNTPLHTAVLFNNETMVEKLCKITNLNLLNKNGETPLFQAVSAGRKVIAELIARVSTDLDKMNPDSEETPLMKALKTNRFDIVKILINQGANINWKNENSESLLHLLTDISDIASVKFLIDMGIEQHVVNQKNETPLHAAVMASNESLLQMLLKEGQIPINAKDYRGYTSLYWAELFHHGSISVILRKHGGVK